MLQVLSVQMLIGDVVCWMGGRKIVVVVDVAEVKGVLLEVIDAVVLEVAGRDV